MKITNLREKVDSVCLSINEQGQTVHAKKNTHLSALMSVSMSVCLFNMNKEQGQTVHRSEEQHLTVIEEENG